MPELSIVMPVHIPNDDLLNLTKNALESFRRADLPEHEFILVDDASPLGGGFLRDTADRYIRHKENLGFSKTSNDGLRLARGKYVVLANNDIRVSPNFYTVAKEIFESNPNVFSVHSRMLFYNDPMELGSHTYLEGKERWCSSSLFIIRNGYPFLFPEQFIGIGGAYEDWYYWSLVRRTGVKTAYTTKSCFQHRDSATNQVLGEQNKFHAENRELYKAEFGDYPEEYYFKLYPDQMMLPWREEYFKL